jgi:leucyl/phenylalanyl-tRNA--protein transferase
VRSIIDLPRLEDDSGTAFPPVSEALDSPNGLLAWGGDLQPQRLLNAYRSGIFPWYCEGQPILWWSPAPRCVIFPEKVHLSKRTRRRYNSSSYQITADSAFTEVVRACAEPRAYDASTWISGDMLDAYGRLHQLGHAHSLEVWENEILVGGIYGLALGSVFFGESMFSRRTDASKIALVALCRQMQRQEYALLDCQVGNPHLFSMGAEEISRTAFEALLKKMTKDTRTTGSWKNLCEFENRW